MVRLENGPSHKNMEVQKMTSENEIGKVVIDAAITLHKELNFGLLETVYEVFLACELERRKLKKIV